VIVTGAATCADLGSSSNYSGEQSLFASTSTCRGVNNLKVEVEKVSSSMEIKGGLVGPNWESNFRNHAVRETRKGKQAKIPVPCMERSTL